MPIWFRKRVLVRRGEYKTTSTVPAFANVRRRVHCNAFVHYAPSHSLFSRSRRQSSARLKEVVGCRFLSPSFSCSILIANGLFPLEAAALVDPTQEQGFIPRDVRAYPAMP
jgi:hypothetical protein